MSKPDILIIGSGSQARYVIDIATHTPGLNIKGIVDIESADKVGQDINGIPVLSHIDKMFSQFEPDQHHVIIAYGNNSKKKELSELLQSKKFTFAEAISSKSYVSPSATIGEGCIINPGAIVMPNANIGNHVILHSLSVVEHDNDIGDWANIAPGVHLAGQVKVGTGATVYTGASVIPKIEIGAWAKVGAGAVVTKNIPENITVAGVPAKSLQ